MLGYTVWCRLWQDRAGKGNLFFREKLVLEEVQALSCVTVPATPHLHEFGFTAVTAVSAPSFLRAQLLRWECWEHFAV